MSFLANLLPRSVRAASQVAPVARRAFTVRAAAADGDEEGVELAGSQTHGNLFEAFKGESMANRRYLYFAQRADVEGHQDVAAVFRSTAEGETGHAFGHLEFLEQVGDPVTGELIGSTAENLASAIAGETHEYQEMYPGFARVARDEGFEDIADWFETLAVAERSHAKKFTRILEEHKKALQ